MEYIRGLKAYDDSRDTAVTLGKFDGLHRGHQKLIREVQRLKKDHGVRSMIFAFDMLPFYQERGIPREGLLTNAERRSRLEGQVDVLLECPFIREVSGTEAEAFITDIIRDRFHAKYVVVGTDFTFGYKARGTPEMLAAFADRCGYALTVVDKEHYQGREISSTFVKEELRKGHVETVRELLGYPYAVSGRAEAIPQTGGRTADGKVCIRPSEEKLLPPAGVYLACAAAAEGELPAVVEVYGPEAVAPGGRRIEVRMTETGMCAGEGWMEVQFYRFLRPQMSFASQADRRAQEERDRSCGRIYFQDERGEEE